MDCGAFISDKLSHDVLTNLDEFIEHMIKCRNIPGMNLAIVHNNETLLTKGYGYSNLEKKTTINDKTLFSVASLTKAFTTTLLGQTLQDKGLSWNTPVRRILGEDFYFNDTLRTNQTTLGDLASHSLGIPSHNYVRLSILKRKELIERLRFLKATKNFRKSWSYNNLMYGLLSHVTEKLGNEEWEAMITDKIFNPLEMKSSNFMHKVDLYDSDIATSYIEDENANHTLQAVSNELHSTWGILGGTGSIISNAEDMAKWLHFLLKEGISVDGKRVMDSKVFHETQTPVNIIPQSKSDALYRQPAIPLTYEHGKYGYGWRIGYYKGFKMILHTGSSWGYGALLTLMPDLNIGIYTNINGGDNGYHGRRLLHMYIIDILSSNESWINQDTMCNFPKEAKLYEKTPSYRIHLESITDFDVDFDVEGFSTYEKKFAKDDIEINQYVGKYGNWGYGNVSVTIKNGELYLLYGEIGIWKLYQITNAIFAAKAQDAIWALDMDCVIFGKDEASKMITHIKVPLEKSDPQTFYRDLTMENTPPPANPNIGIPCENNGYRSLSFNYMLLIACIFTILLSSFTSASLW